MRLLYFYRSATMDFIPNDVRLGGEAEQMVLLTGPNVSHFFHEYCYNPMLGDTN